MVPLWAPVPPGTSPPGHRRGTWIWVLPQGVSRAQRWAVGRAGEGLGTVPPSGGPS